MEELKDIFQGNITKKSLLYYYLPLMIGIYLLCLGIARSLFPYNIIEPYYWTTSMISRIGVPEENPIGFIIFSIGFIIEGIMYLPISIYLYKKFSKIDELPRKFSKTGKLPSKLIGLFLICYSISTFLIGAIPNFSFPPIFTVIHGINASVIFAGFGLMTLVSALTMLNNYLIEKGAIFSRNLLILLIIFSVYYLISFLMILVGFYMTWNSIQILEPTLPFYYSAPFWEWQAYMLTFVILTIQCIILPEDI